jgi:transposase
LFVLYTGIPREFLPQELGFGSGMTCWRRLRDWHQAGPSPVDRARTGSKHRVITEGHGIPLAVSLTGGQRNDVTQLMPLIAAIPPVRGRRGRPRKRPGAVYADRGYDHDKYRRQAREKGITPVIARRGTEHGSGLGVHRWVVEQSLALLHWFRRLRIRWEIRDDIHEAFPQPRLRHHLPATRDGKRATSPTRRPHELFISRVHGHGCEGRRTHSGRRRRLTTCACSSAVSGQKLSPPETSSQEGSRQKTGGFT